MVMQVLDIWLQLLNTQIIASFFKCLNPISSLRYRAPFLSGHLVVAQTALKCCISHFSKVDTCRKRTFKLVPRGYPLGEALLLAEIKSNKQTNKQTQRKEKRFLKVRNSLKLHLVHASHTFACFLMANILLSMVSIWRFDPEMTRLKLPPSVRGSSFLTSDKRPIGQSQQILGAFNQSKAMIKEWQPVPSAGNEHFLP